MTETEFLSIKNSARAMAAELLANWLAALVPPLLEGWPDEARPQMLETIAERLEQGRISYSTLALKGYPPEISDLVAGEFQEAFDKLIGEVKSKLGITP